MWCLACNVDLPSELDARVHFTSEYHRTRLNFCALQGKALQNSRQRRQPHNLTPYKYPIEQTYSNQVRQRDLSLRLQRTETVNTDLSSTPDSSCTDISELRNNFPTKRRGHKEQGSTGQEDMSVVNQRYAQPIQLQQPLNHAHHLAGARPPNVKHNSKKRKNKSRYHQQPNSQTINNQPPAWREDKSVPEVLNFPEQNFNTSTTEQKGGWEEMDAPSSSSSKCNVKPARERLHNSDQLQNIVVPSEENWDPTGEVVVCSGPIQQQEWDDGWDRVTNGRWSQMNEEQAEERTNYKKAYYELPQTISDDCKGIFVSRFDISLIPDDELKAFFTKFGEVTSIKRPSDKDRPFCFVYFSSHDSVLNVLKKKSLYFKNKFLRISPARSSAAATEKEGSKKGKITEMKDNYDFSPLCESGKTFDQNIREFLEIVEIERGRCSKQIAVLKDIEDTYCHLLPGVQAKLFGSSITGLGFKDSDTDIFMFCPCEQPPRHFVAKKAGVMFASPLYKDVTKVSQARVPIITFTHVKTGLVCDVTFLNELGVKNSELLRFLLSLDPRVRQMAMVVKYWARCHDLSGPSRMSNYALTLMVIFYLQQLDEPLLPSVVLLQSLADEKDYCENWDCSFTRDPSALPKITNSMTVKQLLRGFFDYYAMFNFEKYMVCPLLGQLVEKREFENPDTLPPEFDSYKRSLETAKKIDQKLLPIEGRMVVQDPFDMSYNITKHVIEKQFMRYTWFCAYARDEVLDKMEEKELINLFLVPAQMPPCTFGSLEQTYSRDVLMEHIHIPKLDNSRRDLEYKILWFKVVQLVIANVFTRIYQMELRKDTSNESKAAKMEDSTNTEHKVFRTVSFVGEGDADVFVGRKKMRKSMFLSGDPFYKESAVSIALLDAKKRADKTENSCTDQENNYIINIKFCCYQNLDSPKLTVQFTDKCDRDFKKNNRFRAFIQGMTGHLESHILIGVPEVLSNYHCLLTDLDYACDIEVVMLDEEYLSEYIRRVNENEHQFAEKKIRGQRKVYMEDAHGRIQDVDQEDGPRLSAAQKLLLAIANTAGANC